MGTPRVAEALAKLAMFAVDDFSVDDILRLLGEVAAAALAVDGAGVMGTDSGVGDRTRFVYVSRLSMEPLEYLQEANQAGPCKEAALSLLPVVCPTPESLQRWPEFAAAAQVAGIGSVVAAPLISRGRCWGVLDLYWLSRRIFTDDDLAEIDLLAKVAVSYLVIADDRHQASIAQEQLAARLLHDTLTGLANRELIHELIYHALVSTHRRRRSVALLFIDLDAFKSINDTRGHRAGDTVLVAVAQRMRDAVRSSDTVSRLGGDEFLILCEDLPDDGAENAVTLLGERIMTAIATPISVDGGPPVIMTASVGIALTNGQPSVADLIHDADLAMYQAKHEQKKHLAVYRHQTAAAEMDRHRLERHLFGALERGEMRVHYQPVVHAGTGRMVAVEALLRWEHPERGLLAASEFIDFATSNGTILKTGQWMVGEVLSQLANWRIEAPHSAPQTVFVNFTPQQLIATELTLIIEKQLARFGLPASAFGIEITEDALDDTRVRPSAVYLQARGHPLAIDDFGTGYSSLARLIEVPVTYLKIDRSLVSRLPSDGQAQALLKAILVIASSMNLAVIGEGVETVAQSEYLAQAGCDLQQGFLFGRPGPADTVSAVRTPA